MRAKIMKSLMMITTVVCLLAGCGATSETMSISDRDVTDSVTTNPKSAKYSTGNYNSSQDDLYLTTSLASADDEGTAYDTDTSYNEEVSAEEAIEENDVAENDESRTQDLDTMTLLEEKLVY